MANSLIIPIIHSSDQHSNPIKHITNNFSFPLRNKCPTSKMDSLVVTTISYPPKGHFQSHIHHNQTILSTIQEELMGR